MQKKIVEIIRVLLITNSSKTISLIKNLLNVSSSYFFNIDVASNLKDIPEKLTQKSIDIVLFDFSSRLKFNQYVRFRKKEMKTPVIVLTSTKNKNVAVDFIKKGAQDCLFKEELKDKQIEKSILYAMGRVKFYNHLKREYHCLSDQEKHDILEDMFLGLTHNLNNPLFNIKVAIETLKQDKLSSEQEKAVRIIEKKVDVLVSKVRNIISFSSFKGDMMVI